MNIGVSPLTDRARMIALATCLLAIACSSSRSGTANDAGGTGGDSGSATDGSADAASGNTNDGSTDGARGSVDGGMDGSGGSADSGMDGSSAGADGSTDAAGDGSGGSTTRSLTAGTAETSSITTPFGGTCSLLSRDATSCQNAREALGFSGNWLQFSCNVVLGLTGAGGATVTSFSAATNVTVTYVDLPDYTSNYYPTTGSYGFEANGDTVSGTFDSLYSAYTTSFPDPSSLAQASITMSIPITPGAAGTSTMDGGAVGVAINGVTIFDSLAASTNNVFAEPASFDQCQGLPAMGTYHYRSEPYSISYEDNALIGVMRDGYFIYGRNDSDGATPGSTAALADAGTSSSLYKYGGHTGADPVSGSGSDFHYHLTEWRGCFDESGAVKSADDGQSDDTFNSPSGTCGGTWIDAWFMTGHGNGGAFTTVPSGLTGQTPSQSTPGIRYYYGTPGTCTGC